MGTFYQRPNTQADENNFENTNIPQMVRPNSFARWSSIFGTIALIGVFTFTVYPPIIFGSLAIILAFLSRGKEAKLHKTAKTGVILSLSSIGINIAIIITACTVIFGSGESHDEFNRMFEEVYGQSFESMIEDIESGEFDYEQFYENYGL